MNFFDGIALSNFAKSALKGAQKAIDKALDIRDEETGEENGEETSNNIEGAVPEGSWTKENKSEVITDTPTRSEMVDSWGPFKGSFFELEPNRSPTKDFISSQPQKMTLSLSSDVILESTGLAPLATPETELTPIETATGFPSKYTPANTIVRNEEVKETVNEEKHENTNPTLTVSQQVTSNVDHTDISNNMTEDKVIIRPKARKNSSNRNSYISNRLSLISVESEGKKSSESVEVLGSFSCTTSPDTELPSISASSSMGLPLSSSCTDSVEVIDSLGSPSSVEVIGESSSSGRDTQSPESESAKPVKTSQLVELPLQASITFDSSTEVSPDSVEVITEVIEIEEETSIADSYTSASESTGATILEPSFSYASYPDLSQASSKLRSGESTPDIFARFPGANPRHGSCDLLSESIHEVYDNPDADMLYEQVYQRPEPYEQSREGSNDSRKCRSIHGSPTRRPMAKSEERWQISRHKKEPYMSESEGSQTLTGNESSCEGTVMGSSCEDTGKENRESDKQEDKIEEVRVKKLLADAISEDSLTRETSPTLSEKSRSDLVKVGSEQTSGQTSGDELETTTSSDIEIISRYSPNGDSSSTTSRHSPAKLGPYGSKGKFSLVAVDILGKVPHGKTKGHQREPSETSSGCSEDREVETERLTRRVAELTEILDAREAKVIELARTNQELQEEVRKLSGKKSDDEKDEMIKQLQSEGEKLEANNHKLRVLLKKLKENEKTQSTAAEKLRKQVDQLTLELEQTKKKLSEKETAAQSHNETMSKLKSKVHRQDEELASIMEQMEDTVVRAEKVRAVLDETEAKLKRSQWKEETQAAEIKELRRELEVLKVEVGSQDDTRTELEDLKKRLSDAEAMHTKSEAALKAEVTELLRQLQEAEARKEELAQSMTAASRPLLRQLDALQAATSHERAAWEKQERSLRQKLEEAESQLSSIHQHERSFKQEALDLRARVTSLEGQLEASVLERRQDKEALTAIQGQLEALNSLLEREREAFEKQRNTLQSQISEARKTVTAAEEQLGAERAIVEEERRRNSQLSEQLKERMQDPGGSSPQSSPTLSFGRVSLSESMSSNVWPQFADESYETSSVSGRCSNVYDSLRMGNTTAIIEGLQAQLKMRDGEVSQMQWESQRREAERLALTAEISAVTARLEELEAKVVQGEVAEVALAELRRNYDALLQMYGEKVEEVDELRLDLQDVKDMYKTQIEQLLKGDKMQT